MGSKSTVRRVNDIAGKGKGVGMGTKERDEREREKKTILSLSSPSEFWKIAKKGGALC